MRIAQGSDPRGEGILKYCMVWVLALGLTRGMKLRDAKKPCDAVYSRGG